MLIDTAPIFTSLYAVIPIREGRGTPYDLECGSGALPRLLSTLESGPRNRINYVQAPAWHKPNDPVYCLPTGGQNRCWHQSTCTPSFSASIDSRFACVQTQRFSIWARNI